MGYIQGDSAQLIDAGSNGNPVAAVAEAGYHFFNWSDGITTATRTEINVSNDIVVTANFSKDTNTQTIHDVHYYAGANGSIAGLWSQDIHDGRSTTEVTALANTGYHFKVWSDGIATAKRTDNNVAQDINVTASFEADTMSSVIHDVHYYAGANGLISGSWSQDIQDGNNTSQVIATPDTGFHFVDWSDGITTAQRIDTNVAHDINVTARFEKDSNDGDDETAVIDFIFEDAQDGNTDNWDIYDTSPTGASIINVEDPQDPSNRAIRLSGTDLNNGFIYRFIQAETKAKHIQWRMKSSSDYQIFVGSSGNLMGDMRSNER